MVRANLPRKIAVALLIAALTNSFTVAAIAAVAGPCAAHVERAADLHRHGNHESKAPDTDHEHETAPRKSDLECCPLHCGGILASVEQPVFSGWTIVAVPKAGPTLAPGDASGLDPPPRSLL